MGTVTYYVAYLVSVILRLFEMLLFIRAIASWFPAIQQSSFYTFLVNVTEPVLQPVRSFLMRFEALRRLPIDFSVLATFLLLEILQTLLAYVL